MNKPQNKVLKPNYKNDFKKQNKKTSNNKQYTSPNRDGFTNTEEFCFGSSTA